MKPPAQILPDDLPEECRQIAEIIGMDALMALVAARGGERLYIPKRDSLEIEARNRAIRAQFNGRNYRDLARRHNLTVRWVRHIVAGRATTTERTDKPVDRQMRLF